MARNGMSDDRAHGDDASNDDTRDRAHGDDASNDDTRDRTSIDDASNDDTRDRTSIDGTVRYLGLAWIRELTREVAESEVLAELAADHSIGVTQVVVDGPEGDVTYHLQIGDGEARFGAGPADPEDVRMEQDWTTAVAVACGEANAQDAFVNGRIRLFGDQQALMSAQPVFGALDHVFSTVRERTRYE